MLQLIGITSLFIASKLEVSSQSLSVDIFTEDVGLIPGLGRYPGNSSPIQYSCLENPLDKGSFWATVHGVTIVGKSWNNLASLCRKKKKKSVHLMAMTEEKDSITQNMSWVLSFQKSIVRTNMLKLNLTMGCQETYEEK